VPEPEYGESLKPLFPPDPDCMQQWAALARDARMEYAVLTTKHHEGYTRFNSKAPWSQANDMTGGTNLSPKGRDLVAEYANAFRSAGVIPGFYYSWIDWQHPQGDANRQYLYRHLDEWPDSGVIRLEGLLNTVKRARLLGTDAPDLEISGQSPATIRIPDASPEMLLPVLALDLEGTPRVEELPYVLQAPDRKVVLEVADALIQGADGKPNASWDCSHSMRGRFPSTAKGW
jgi:hypothetical protein